MMTLPESLSQQFDIELKAFEETKKMKYVTTTQRRILARAEAQGEVKQARSFVQRLLTRRFGELQDSLLETLDVLSIDRLESLGEALLDFTSIEDLTHWLDTHYENTPSENTPSESTPGENIPGEPVIST